MISARNQMSCGILINGVNYNVLCYADDILLMSSTASGLQSLIDFANASIKCLGLRFNPSKTVCAVFGKCPLVNAPAWTLEGAELKIEQTLTYLGVL